MTWPMARLDDVIDFIRGITFKPTDVVPPFTHNSIVVMRTKNVQVEGLDCSDLISVPRHFMKREEQRLKYGDLLISSANSWELVGKTSFVEKLDYDATAGGFISIVRAKKNNVDPKYLYYWLVTPETQHTIRHLGKQTTNISNLDVARFKRLEIPLPPLVEQKRIAAILDKADAIRQKRQQAIALADQFLRSVFLDMFGDPVTNPKGWEMQPISKVAEVQGGLQVTKKREGLPVTCPYLRVANVYRGKLDLSEVKTMQVTDAELERVSLVKDDILVVEGHGNKEEIGRCAMWDGSIESIIHQNHLIRVRVIKDRVLPQYLADFINSEGGRTQLIGASNTTSGLNTISTRLVKETEVLIPDLQTQERYVHIFNKVKEALRCFQKGTLGCTELFESVSQKAFSGQL